MTNELDQALAHHRAGRLPEAEAIYRSILAREPACAEALHWLGVVALQRQQYPDATELIARALARKPDDVEALNDLGLALEGEQRIADAVTAYKRALEINPGFGQAACNLGLLLTRANRLGEARNVLERAVQANPDLAEVHYNLGNVLVALGQTAAAITAYERTLALDAQHADACNNLGLALQAQERVGEAIAALRRSLILAPNDPEIHNNLGVFLFAQGEHELGLTHLRQALALEPAYAEAHSNLFQAMHYVPGIGPEALFAEAKHWAARHAAPFAKAWRPHGNVPDPARRLRVGYVSADLGAHPVGFFFLPVFIHHDRSEFELYAYSGVRQPDAMTEAFKTHTPHWREVAGLEDGALAERIRKDGIDILVDLSGHTREHRLLAFARKPAPIQVTAGGHYDTTGMEAIDYLIADRFHAPAGAERYFTETLVRLPHDYICYAPPAYAPDVAEPPCRREGILTFGCYNNLAKVNAQVIALWTRILTALPGSRLRLQTRELNDPATRARYRERFAAAGLPAERLLLAEGVPHGELLAAYGAIDIALDPFPYSGGLTTLEALWMGVPVVTLTGQGFCGRHSTAHLANLGLPECVTTTPEDYVGAALALARDPERLAGLRAGLRERMAASPLCDAAGYTRALEAAYRGMWERYCSANKR